MKGKPLKRVEWTPEQRLDNMADDITHLRAAVALLANCVGPNVISENDARRISRLLSNKP